MAQDALDCYYRYYITTLTSVTNVTDVITETATPTVTTVTVWLVPMLFDDKIARATGVPKATLVATSLFIYGGWIAGCCVLSPAGDRFGRKRVLILSALLAAAGAFGTALTPLMPAPTACVILLAASRAIGGFSLGGMMSQALALALESSESNRLKSGGILMNMYYCTAVIILAAFHALCGVCVAPAWVEPPLPHLTQLARRCTACGVTLRPHAHSSPRSANRT